MITEDQARAVVARYSWVVEAEGSMLWDLESGAPYAAPSVRHAIGWIAAGESEADPKTARLALWWHNPRRAAGRLREPMLFDGR
jgi:hypothetical protein